MSLLSLLPQTPPEIRARAQKNSENARPTFALYTLGCKVNQYDSHQIARELVAQGFRRVPFRESADLYVIDTCTVTAQADQKSRKAASRARRNNPDGLVAVTGCAATKDAAQFQRAAPGALVLNNAEKFDLPMRALEKLEKNENFAQKLAALRAQTGSEPVPAPTRERAVLKIQDGCNHKCSYCIIPRVRGASQIKTTPQIMSEARAFVAEGARELVVTGVSMGDFSKLEIANRSAEFGQLQSESAETGRNRALCELLRAVATIEGLERVRVSSLDPADVDEQWLQTVAQTDKIMPQIHLALQNGAPSVLRRMRRRYAPELFLKWALRWRELRPDGGLTTDVIVGFPGETDDEWAQTLDLCRKAKFSAIHVFPYSPREQTFAADHLKELGGLVSPQIQQHRVAQLIELGRELSANFAAQFVGKSAQIMVESSSQNDFCEGLLPSYLSARVAMNGKSARAGDLIEFHVEQWDGERFLGRAL